ncbi:MAG: chemotaxis protein CheW [Pirellulales bacterium]|nr:chemotaxis protein CheW [Pirellulales bacterium]
MSDRTVPEKQGKILDDIPPEVLVEADDLLESLNKHLLQLDEGAKERKEQAAPQSIGGDFLAGIADDENIPANYLGIFIDETETSLDALTELLLDGFDDNIAERLLVICHRIKGSAATIGLNCAAALGHSMEDLLQDLEEENRKPTAAMADALLGCADALRCYVDGLKNGESNTSNFQTAYDKLQAARYLGVRKSQKLSPGPPPPVAPSQAEGNEDESSKQPLQNNGDTESEEDSPETPACFNQEALTRLITAAPAGSDNLAVQVSFRLDVMLVGMKARLLFEKLGCFGNVFFCNPAEEELDEMEELEQLIMGVTTQDSLSDIEASLSVEGVKQLIFETVIAEEAPGGEGKEGQDSPRQQEASTKAAQPTLQQQETTKPAAPAGETAGKPVETVRVDIGRLDQLMNLAGQLAINKARFSQISASMKRSVGTKSSANTINDMTRLVEQLRNSLEDCSNQRSLEKNLDMMRGCLRRFQADMEPLQQQLQQVDEIRFSVNDLFEAVHQLDRVSDGIQKGVMDTRMVPIGPLFGRFKRVVRDISRNSGKHIRLEIRGEHTELDKRMIDELGDPLIHIVRNSADHGIESPEDREAAGKPAEGTVILDASHRGNSIVIEIIDDGKGLATEQIRAKAIEKGVVSAADAEKLSDYQVHQLIWEPGFSTAEQVTNVSGRGLGMDIVRSKIDEINGVVEIHSTAGRGTRIAIKLPLTLAILPSLLAEIEGDVFAMPVESVAEIVRLSPADLSTVHGQPTAMVRGQVISVVYLPSLFRWSHPARNASGSAHRDETILVIVESDGQQLGIVVDRLLGEEDIVIKSLAENYQNVDGVAGASVLGDGRVSLILDTNAILAAASGQAELQSVV